MDSASPEFTRAWQLYFKQRGGIGPGLPPDVMPVVVMDDNTGGPYPPCRIWHAGMRVGPVAAQLAYVGIQNADGAQPGAGLQGSNVINSRVVIDRVTFASSDSPPTVPIDVQVRLADVNSEPFNGVAGFVAKQADESGADPVASAGFAPRVGNVWIGARNTTPIFTTGAQIVPVRSLLAQTLSGPFTLPPQTILYVINNALAGEITAFFQGRYYGGA